METILQPLMDLEQSALEGFHDLGLGWGMAIVALTIVVRLAIVPLAVRGMRAGRRRKDHAPQLKALRKQHHDDPVARRRELKHYRRRHRLGHGPVVTAIVVQLLVVVSLGVLLRSDAGTGTFGDSGWLLIDDLSEPAGGSALAALIGAWVALRAASVYAARRGPFRLLALRLLPPLAVLPAAAVVPSGVLLYLVVSAIFGAGQRAALNATLRRPAMPSVAPAPAA